MFSPYLNGDMVLSAYIMLGIMTQQVDHNRSTGLPHPRIGTGQFQKEGLEWWLENAITAKNG